MSTDAPGHGLLRLTGQNPPGTPYGAKYKDPVPMWILTTSLPGVSDDQRESLVDVYAESRVEDDVIRFLEWWERHDGTVILIARVVAVMLPLLLSYTGYTVGVVVSVAAAAVISTEWVDRVRTRAERDQHRVETMRQYYREVERPRVQAQKREYRR